MYVLGDVSGPQPSVCVLGGLCDYHSLVCIFVGGGLCDHHVLVGIGGVVPVTTTVGRVKFYRRQEGSLVRYNLVASVGSNSESQPQIFYFINI